MCHKAYLAQSPCHAPTLPPAHLQPLSLLLCRLLRFLSRPLPAQLQLSKRHLVLPPLLVQLLLHRRQLLLSPLLGSLKGLQPLGPSVQLSLE